MYELEVDDRGLRRAIGALTAGINGVGLEPGWQATGERMRDAAEPLVPVAAGHLVDSLLIETTGSSVELSSDLVYAGVQDRGWPARNITGSHFMDAAEQVADDAAGNEVGTAIDSLTRRVGLN